MKLEKYSHFRDYYCLLNFSNGLGKMYDFEGVLKDKYNIAVSDFVMSRITDDGLYWEFNNGLVKVGCMELFEYKPPATIEKIENEIVTISPFTRLYKIMKQIIKL